MLPAITLQDVRVCM